MITLLYLILLIYLSYWIGIFLRLVWMKNDTPSDESLDISILVCVKNGERHLHELIPLLLVQGAKEIIIVDDFSDDNTAEIITSYPEVKYIHASTNRPGKKVALYTGIHSASSDYILLTDVDCRMGDKWLRCMASGIQGRSIVLGYSPMKKRKGLVPLFSRYETFHTVIQYMGYHTIGQTYMGVGRNMLVKKSAALEAESYILSSHMASGDDDLLVNHLAKYHEIGICLDKDSFVYTEPQLTLIGFLTQKSRHISTAYTYTIIQKMMLGAYSLLHMTFYILCIVSVACSILSYSVVLTMIVIKWAIQTLVTGLLSRRFGEYMLWIYTPLLDILMFLYLLVLTPFIFVKNNTRWS